ncbi:pyrroline-5-carboxylate reductase [Microbacterium sp.]|uniref:pyrroline-5-carboxylate reductase n=1 Tax=Microbacterium sp. TaxID=51671 RepID=UPI003A8409DD
MPSLSSIAILGAGSMGGAVLHGILHSGRATDVTVTNRSREKSQELAELIGVSSIAIADARDGNRVAVRGAEIVLIGVKPAMVPDLLREIAAELEPDAIVVSLAAGVTIATFESILPDRVRVVRSMPNTPALIGKGVTGIAAGTRADAGAMAAVRDVFETCGAVVEVPEERIDALSTISGSGPAYVFLLIEQFTAAARAQGFDTEQARLLAEQTFIGATALLEATGEDPAELRRRVTSLRGTTERAIAVLHSAGLDAVFAAAADAALARARELAQGS